MRMNEFKSTKKNLVELKLPGYFRFKFAVTTTNLKGIILGGRGVRNKCTPAIGAYYCWSCSLLTLPIWWVFYARKN